MRGTTADQALQIIPRFNEASPQVNKAAQSLFAVRGMSVDSAMQILPRVAEMGDKLGIDGILDELTKRVSEGGAVREVDLDHVLAGGTLATMPSALGLVPDDEPASGEPAEEGAVVEPEEGETDGTGAPVDRAVGAADPDDEADSAPGELTGVPDGFGETADDGSGAIDPEEAVVDDSDVSDEEETVEAEGEDPDEETGESGENFDNFFD